MGGSQSTQSVSDTLNAATSVTQSVSNSCVSYVDSSNTVVVDGNGNVAEGITQSIKASVSTPCVTSSMTQSNIQNSLSSSTAQSATAQGVSMTQWMDNTKQNTNTDITENLSTALSSSTAQTCVLTLDQSNAIMVSGDANTIKNITQSNTGSLIGKCLMGTSDVSDAANTITNTSNQYSSQTSTSMFAFLGEAMETIAAMGIAGFIFVIIVAMCIGGVYYMLKHKKAKTTTQNANTSVSVTSKIDM